MSPEQMSRSHAPVEVEFSVVTTSRVNNAAAGTFPSTILNMPDVPKIVLIEAQNLPSDTHL